MSRFQHELFDADRQSDNSHRPLAERMRPKTLAAMVGHSQILGEHGLLLPLLRANKSVSLIIFGPSGSGKTTLAYALAAAHNVPLTVLSAVEAGIKDIRLVAEQARAARGFHNRPTWLFIDEIHRFNRGQQDALLPLVESGLVTLLGATTENPAFEINAALLSRCRVLRLGALTTQDIALLLGRALADSAHGLGALNVTASQEVLQAVAQHSLGDARRALGTLEAAAALASGRGSPAIALEDAKLAAQERFLAHDKTGQAHHTLLSALIKSMRASDADAAVYYLARLLEAGEPPRTPLRRMVIFASEDVGPADPQALILASATLHAFECVGMPEGTLPLTQLAIYLARANKSRAAVDAYGRAQELTRKFGALIVPAHLHPSGKDSAPLGFGRARGGPQIAGDAASNLPLGLGPVRIVDPP